MSGDLTTAGRESLALSLSKLNSREVAELRRTLLTLGPLQVVDLWEDAGRALTFWVLILNGADNEDERRIASSLCLWKQLAIKESARLLCIQTSDRRAFRLVCRRFNVDRCPALVMGDTPSMESFLTLDGRLLLDLSTKKGELARFVNRLHTMIENGSSLKSLGRQLGQEKFWKQARLAYQEVKSLFSVNLKVG